MNNEFDELKAKSERELILLLQDTTEIDKGIIYYLSLFNSLKDVFTLYSCEGHPNKPCPNFGYLWFAVRDIKKVTKMFLDKDYFDTDLVNFQIRYTSIKECEGYCYDYSSVYVSFPHMNMTPLLKQLYKDLKELESKYEEEK
jgi:hypothetical protein